MSQRCTGAVPGAARTVAKMVAEVDEVTMVLLLLDKNANIFVAGYCYTPLNHKRESREKNSYRYLI